MNGTLAFTIEPGWASLIGTGVIALVGIVFHFYGDARWVRKPDAETKAVAAKEALDREVKELKEADAQVKKAIEELAATVKDQDTTARADMTSLRREMNEGLTGIKDAVNAGILALTKEVSEMRGRLAGANGVPKAE